MFHPDDLSLISGVGVGSISSNNAIASLMKFILPNSTVSLVDQPFLWPPITKLEAKPKINKLSNNTESDADYVYDEERSNLSNLLDILNLSQNFDELFQPTLLIPHPIIIKPKYEKEFLNINDEIITDFIVPSIKNALHEFPDKMPLLFEHLDKFIGSTEANPNNCDIAFASGVSEILFESIYSTHYDTQTLANVLNSCIRFIVQFGSSIDCFLLARAWIQSSPRPILDLNSLIDIIGYENLPQISPKPPENEPPQKMPLAHFFNDLTDLKISMYSGYIFAAGRDYGVVKIGTGFNGTISGSFVCRNVSLSSFSSKFICVINDVVIYGAYSNEKSSTEFNIFYLDAIALKIIEVKKEKLSTFHDVFCSCNRFVYKNDWKGKITKFSVEDKTNFKEERNIKTEFKPTQFFKNKSSENNSSNSNNNNNNDDDNENNNNNNNYNENVDKDDLTFGAIDEFTNGINYYIYYPKHIIEISLQDGSYKSIPVPKKSPVINYRYVFDSITTQFYIIDDQGLSIITDNQTFGRIPPPSPKADNPLDIIHFLTYAHKNLQSRFALTPSFSLLFPLIQSIVSLKKAAPKVEPISVKKPSMPLPEFIPSPRAPSSMPKNSLSSANYDEFIDFCPILLEASTQSLKSGNILSDDLFNIFLERLNFFYEKYPVVTLAFLATYLTSEETSSKSEVVFQNKIDFSILFEAASQLPCLHQAYVYHFLSDDKSLKAIYNLFENLDHKGVAFLNVLSESLAYQLIKNAADVIPFIQQFIDLIHYSKSPLFYSFLESFFYVFQKTALICSESTEMLIRVLPFLTDPMKANTINDSDKITINKTDVLSLNSLQLSSDIPISTNQDAKVSRLIRIFDLELPVTSKISLKFNFQQKITCDQLCLFVYTTKSQKEHEAFLPASGSPPTDKIEVEFNSSYIAIDVDVVENNSKDLSNNDENGNNNSTFEFTYSLSCTIPILTATETLMNMNVFQLYWCKALTMIKRFLSSSKIQLIDESNSNSNEKQHHHQIKQTTHQLFDVVFQNIPRDIYHKIFYRFRNIDINLINTKNNIKFIQDKLKSKNFNERLFYLSIASRIQNSFSSEELMKNWRELFIIFSFVMNHKKNLQEIENEQQAFIKILQNYQSKFNTEKMFQTKNDNVKLKSNNDFGFELDLNLNLDCLLSISEFQNYAENQFSYIIKSIVKSKESKVDYICKIIFELMNLIDQNKIPIITSNMIIIAKAISFLPNDSTLVDKKFIKNLILSHLTKCIDDTLELVFIYESIFNKFDIKIDKIDDLIKNVLESVEVTQGNLDNKYYFQCCRFLRHFMSVDALNNLSTFIEKVEQPIQNSNDSKNSDDDDDNNNNKSIEDDIAFHNYKGSCLGALMILSSRYSPLSINDKYIMCSNRDKKLYKEANSEQKDNIHLTINDYNCLVFSFETDDGMILSHSPFDFHTYLPLFDNSFYKKVLEEPLPKLSTQLVKNVVQQTKGKFRSLAIDALCDLSINSFNEPLKYLDYLEKNQFIKRISLNKEKDENYIIEIEESPKPHFIVDQNNFATNLVEMQEAYKTDNIKRSKFKKSKEFSIFLRSFFSAKHKPVNVYIFNQPGTDFKIILSRFDKYKLLLNDDHNREICIWSITDHFIASVLTGNKSSIFECYFGILPRFQIVYLKLGSHFWVNPVQYTHDIKKVRLGIVGDEYTFDAFVIDEPPDFLIPAFKPKYLLFDNSIKSFEKFEKKSKKLESDISLLPFLKNEGQLFYMELTYNCKHMKFSLSPSLMSSMQFYSFDLPTVENSSSNQTVGITIDFMQNMVGIKSENKIIKESVVSFDYIPNVCLMFHHDEAKVIEFNFGTKPFLYLFRTLPVKSTKHCTVEYTNDDSNDKYSTYHFSPTIQTPFKPTGLSFPIEIGRPAFLNKNSKPLIGMIRNDRFLTSTFSTTVPLLSPLIKDLKDSFISFDSNSQNNPSSQFLQTLASTTAQTKSGPDFRNFFIKQFISFVSQSNSNNDNDNDNNENDVSDSVEVKKDENDDDENVNSPLFVDFFTNESNCSIKTKDSNSFNDLMLWSTPFDSVENVEIATVHSLFFLRDRIDPQYHKEFSRLARRALNEYDGNFCNPHNLTIKNYELDLSHKSEIIINLFMNLIHQNKNFFDYFNKFDSFYNKLLIEVINNLSTVDLRIDYPFSNLLFELIKSRPKHKKEENNNNNNGNIKFVRHYLIESSKMFTNINILISENGKYRSIHGNSIGNFERISDLECDAVIFLTTRIGNNKNSKIKLVDKYQNKVVLKAFYDHKKEIIDYKNNYNCVQTLLRSEFIFDKIRYHDAIMCSFVPIDFKHPEQLLYDNTKSFRNSYCDYYKKKKDMNKLSKRLNSDEENKNKKSIENKNKYCQKVGFAFAIHFINHVYEYIKNSKDKIIANMFNKYFLRPVFYEIVFKKVCIFDRYVAKWMSLLITNRDLFTEKTIISYRNVKSLSYEQFQFDQFPYNELSYVVRLLMMIGDCYVSNYVLEQELDHKYEISQLSYFKSKHFKNNNNNNNLNFVDNNEIIDDDDIDDDGSLSQNYGYDYSSDDEFEENGLCFYNFYHNDEIDEIKEKDEINEVESLLKEENEKNKNKNSFDSQISQEQRKRISSTFIIDRSFSKRAISIYKAIAAEFLNPLGCHVPFFSDLFMFPCLTQIITNEFFKWRPDLKPPTILLSSISPSIPYIHKAKKGSIPIIYGNPPPAFRIQGYEFSDVDRAFFEMPSNNKEKNAKEIIKNKIKNESDIDSFIDSEYELEIKSDDDNINDSTEKVETTEMKLKRRKIQKVELLNDFGLNLNDDFDNEKYRYFIISNPSNLPISIRFQISFLSDFIEAKNLPDVRKLNQINQWLYELKLKWNLHYEATCFFIHTLLNSFKCSFVNFKVFEPIIKNIFPSISCNAALFQLMMTSFRMRSGFSFKPIYNYQLDDDLSFIDLVSPDPIKIPKDYYRRSSTSTSSSSSYHAVADSTESTATAVTTMISSEISSVASTSRNITTTTTTTTTSTTNTTATANTNPNNDDQNPEPNLSVDSINNNNDDDNDNDNDNENVDADADVGVVVDDNESILSGIHGSRTNQAVNGVVVNGVGSGVVGSASSSVLHSRSHSQNSSNSNFNLNLNMDLSFLPTKGNRNGNITSCSFGNDTTGKLLSDFYISASKSFDFCFPHNYKEFAPLSESILSSYTENDLFTNEHIKSRSKTSTSSFSNVSSSEWETAAFLPRVSATGKRELEAFSAFGSHLVVAFEIGSSVPFLVSRVVIRYAFDCKLILDDFADVDIEFAKNGKEENISEKISPIKKQLDAIRMGVLKMRPIKYHSYFKLDYFPRVFQMMPFVDVLQLMEENRNTKPYVVFKSVLSIIEGLKERGKRVPVTKNCII